jgi:hypothetical protein
MHEGVDLTQLGTTIGLGITHGSKMASERQAEQFSPQQREWLTQIFALAQ